MTRMRMTQAFRVSAVRPTEVTDALLDGFIPQVTACRVCIHELAHDENHDGDEWEHTWALERVTVLMTAGPCQRCARLWRMNEWIWNSDYADLEHEVRALCHDRDCTRCAAVA